MIVRPPVVEDGQMLSARAQVYAATMYPEFIPDIDKIHHLIRSATYDKEQSYSRVIGEEGHPVAALITKTEHNLWAMKKHAAVLLWYSDLPGAGALLLRGFRDWLKTQKHIMAAGFSADWVQIDARPLALATRIGFKRRGEGGFFYFPPRRRA